MSNTVILARGSEPAVQFAARELSRYLKKATGLRIPVARCIGDNGKTGSLGQGQPLFTLGVCDRVGVKRPAGVSDADDWISIQPRGAGYILTGSNPRSVLFAVYRYLRELGFRWLRPGSRGEIVPRLRSPLRRGLAIDERASYRFRTVCIEGATTEKHVVDLIDWAAKHAMNGYFLQFQYGLYFFQRWYSHHDNPHRPKVPFGIEQAKPIVERIIGEIKKRGLSFERVGHGWTCAALGLPGEGWGQLHEPLTQDRQKWLAMLKGERTFFGGVPVNTNLCYSNPDVRKAMTDSIASYAAEHPEVNVLHFWLADGSNNNCECPECQKARPSDFFVQMLNELDEKLSAAGLSTRIVFLIYVDLLWPPAQSRLSNPDRFILMFAPITRSYLSSFAEAIHERIPMKEYVRNQLQFPRSAAENLAYLKAWRELFSGDGFDFDYHVIWPCYYDLNHFTLGRTLHKDIRSLEAIGLQGLNSCQNQRCSYPTNLLMDILARTLWNKRVSFDAIVKESFTDAFGKPGLQVAEALDKMSRLWLPLFEGVYATGRDDARIAKGLKNFPKLVQATDYLKSIVRKNLPRSTGAIQWSWKYLDGYVELLRLLLPAYEAYLHCSDQTAEKFQAVFDYLWKQEKTLHPALDVDTFIKVLQWRVNEVKAEREKTQP